MLANVAEKPATVENHPLREVSKIRSMVTDAVEDGVRSASQAIRHGRYAAEDAIESETHSQAEATTGNGHSFCGRHLGWDLFNLDRIPSSLSAGQQKHCTLSGPGGICKTVFGLSLPFRAKNLLLSIAAVL